MTTLKHKFGRRSDQTIDIETLSLGDALQMHRDLHALLAKRREELDEYWSKILPVKSNGRTSLKGTKVPPKYKGPRGELWAGRGARPKWLTAAMKGNKKLTLASFLIK